jgi:hypothetical protein
MHLSTRGGVLRHAAGSRIAKLVALAAPVAVLLTLPWAVTYSAYSAPTATAASFSTGSWATYAAAVNADGPVAYWRLDETSGTTVVDAIASRSATLGSGTTTNGAGATSDGAKALSLNGTTQATGPNVFPFTGNAPFSVEAWVIQTVPPATDIYPGIVSKEDTTSTRVGWTLLSYDVSGKMVFEFARRSSTDANAIDSATPVAYNTWHHVAGTYDGTALRIYVNGALSATEPDAPASIPANTARLLIGATGYSGNSTTGRIDEVAIYNKALTAARIKAHYDAR